MEWPVPGANTNKWQLLPLMDAHQALSSSHAKWGQQSRSVSVISNKELTRRSSKRQKTAFNCHAVGDD